MTGNARFPINKNTAMALSILKRSDKFAKILSDKIFYCVVAGTLFFGFFVNAITVGLFADRIAAWDFVIFTIVYIVMTIVGLFVNALSRNPVVSFIGYCMVILPIGAYLSLLLPHFAYETLRSAFVVTALLSLVMLVLAVIYPAVFQSMIKLLGVCLLVALLYQIVAVFAGFGSGTFVDWVIVLLFCCYIGFDISFARKREKTLDNAVDSACGLYLDIVNLFVRLLVLFASSKK